MLTPTELFDLAKSVESRDPELADRLCTLAEERSMTDKPKPRVVPNGGQYGQHFQEAYKLCMEKHRDYGPSNIDEAGVIGIVIRLGDKMARFKTILSQAGVTMNDSPEEARRKIREATATDDKFIDDLLDVANYAIIARMWLAGQWGDDALDMYGPAYFPRASKELPDA